MANGPCLFICVPIILPCVSGLAYGEKGISGWKTGLKFAVIFSFARLAAYGFLGWAAVVVYRLVFAFIVPRGVYLQFSLGLLIIIIGILYFFNNSAWLRRLQVGPCGCRRLISFEKSAWHIALFGLLIGLSPCPPLLAMLTYISATAGDPWSGLGSGLVFGLGTLITPLIPLAVFSGFIADKAKKNSRAAGFLRFASAAILIYFGFRLILP